MLVAYSMASCQDENHLVEASSFVGLTSHQDARPTVYFRTRTLGRLTLRKSCQGVRRFVSDAGEATGLTHWLLVATEATDDVRPLVWDVGGSARVRDRGPDQDARHDVTRWGYFLAT